jgi:hypothetical protein
VLSSFSRSARFSFLRSYFALAIKSAGSSSQLLIFPAEDFLLATRRARGSVHPVSYCRPELFRFSVVVFIQPERAPRSRVSLCSIRSLPEVHFPRFVSRRSSFPLRAVRAGDQPFALSSAARSSPGALARFPLSWPDFPPPGAPKLLCFLLLLDSLPPV